MEETKKEQLMEKMIYSICDFKDEVIKSMNYIRQDMNYLRQDMNYLRDELKEEMKELKSELQGEMKELKSELQGEMKELKSELQEEMKELKSELQGEINDLRSELREYKEENDKRWEKYECNRIEDRKFLLDALTSYDISISEQLGDPNVEKMRKLI